MKYKFGTIICAFLGIASIKPALAEQIDVLNDGVHYADGELTSTETTDEGYPIIEGNSLSDDDAIVFTKEDTAERVDVDLGTEEKFILQGNVVLDNPIVFTGNTLQINGYLTENTQNDADGSDFSGVNLKFDNYVIPHVPLGEDDEDTEDEVVNGKLVLKNDITLGQAAFNDGVQIHLYKPNAAQTVIGATSGITFAGNNLITGDKNSSLLIKNGGGNVVFNGVTHADANVADVEIGVIAQNNGILVVDNDLTLTNDFVNQGNVSVGGSFAGKNFVNGENSSLSINGVADFGGNVENHKANVTLNSNADFAGDVTSDGNTNFRAKGNTKFAGMVNSSGNTTMTFDQQLIFYGAAGLHAQDNATITANGEAQFNSADLNDYARLTTKGNAEFNGVVTTSGHARIVTEDEAIFSGVVNNSGNSLIQTKGNTNFNAAVNNAENARLQIDGTANFLNAQTVTNKDNATMDINGKAIFSGAVNNNDDAQVNINGSAEFAKVVTNNGYGRFTSNGEVVFHGSVSNSSNAKLILNGNSLLEKNLTNNGEVISRGEITIANSLTNNGKMTSTGPLKVNYLQNDTVSAEMYLGEKTSIYGGAFNRGLIETTGDIDFDGVYMTSDNGKLNVGGNALFASNGSYNIGQVAVSGDATFKGSFTNSGLFKVNGNTYIDNVLTNDSTGDMQLNDVTFADSNARLENSGNLSLSNTTLGASIANNSSGVINLLGNNTLGGDWQSNGLVNFASSANMNLGSNRLSMIGDDKTITFNNGATLSFNIDKVGDSQEGGKIEGDVKLNGNTELKPVFAFGLTAGEYSFVDGSVDSASGNWSGYNNNALYNVELGSSGDKISFNKKSNEEIAEATGTQGTQTELLSGILQGSSDNAGFNQMANTVSEMLQSGDKEQKQKALRILDAISPEEAPMIQQAAVETSNQIFDVVGARLANRTPMMMRSWRKGLSSGDEIFDSGAAWVQGMGNKSELKESDDHSGFESTTTGVAMGFEKQITENTRAGLGYAYSQTEVDSDLRNIDATTHTAIGYAEYKRNKFFANAIAAYGWSNYEENSAAASAKYVVESMGLQAMAGYYGLTTGALRFIPEMGARYVHVKQHDYDNSIGIKYDNLSSDILTGIIGARISAIGGNANGLKIIPEARLALTYDIENPDGKDALITLPNGSSYIVKGKALDRFGVEFGAGITAEVNDNVGLSINYEGKFRKDYTDHTGVIKGKYKF